LTRPWTRASAMISFCRVDAGCIPANSRRRRRRDKRHAAPSHPGRLDPACAERVRPNACGEASGDLETLQDRQPIGECGGVRFQFLEVLVGRLELLAVLDDALSLDVKDLPRKCGPV